MRIPVITRERDDRGAVALLVALLFVVLLGIGAFTADFGMAYVNKRQIQTAADAAALGAAGVYSTVPGASGCSTVLTNGMSAASAEAASKVAVNDNDAAPATHQFLPTCDNGTLKVKVNAKTDSQSFFGRLFGKDKYTVTRSATATVGVASSVGSGLRPLALCSRDLLTLTSFPTPVMKFEGPSEGHASGAGTHQDCPDTMNPGNWWTLRCPSSTDNLAYNLTNGCRNPVSLVPGQPAPGSPTLTSHLLNYCSNPSLHPESCLTSDPGNMRDNGSLTALKDLVDREETVFLPAFCGTPTCDPGAVSPDGGSNTIYPVFRLVAVRICGFHFGNGSGSYDRLTGDCAANPNGFDADINDNQRNFLLVSVQQVNVSGPIVSTGCKVGDPCDTGLRQVNMTE
jgi:Flp pilus assembly protein TadG